MQNAQPRCVLDNESISVPSNAAFDKPHLKQGFKQVRWLPGDGFGGVDTACNGAGGAAGRERPVSGTAEAAHHRCRASG